MTDNPTESTGESTSPLRTAIAVSQNGPFGDRCTKIFRCLKMFSVWIFTDWPWETAKCIINTIEGTREDAEVLQQPQAAIPLCNLRKQSEEAGQQGDAAELPDACPVINSNSDERTCCYTALCNTLWFVLIFSRLLFIIAGTAAQLMTCFRRDMINTPIANTSTTKLLKCDDKREVISGLLIPDGVVILVAIWVYFGLKCGDQYCKCICCKCRELKTAVKADTAKRLNALVEDVESKLQKESIIACYTVIPLMYIVLSQVASSMYLVAFHLTNKGVVIQPTIGEARLAGDLKFGIIALSFAGFISLDFLYLRVTMRYVYRCQMIIYYLQIIRENVKNQLNDENNPEAGGNEDNRRALSDQAIKAHKYIKELNANSAITGYIILIAAFQATNSALTLLDKEITYFQAGALSLRLVLWGVLFLLPFQKAAGVNIASTKLCETGLDICRSNNGSRSNNEMDISLIARMFGISVNPWLPYVVVNLLLLTLMAGSKYK